MKPMPRSLLQIFLMAFVALLLLACPNRGRERKEAELAAKRSAERAIADANTKAIRERLASLALQYNADSEWPDRIASVGPHGLVLTLSLQEALVREAEKPILFVAELNDLWKRNGTYWVKLSLSCAGDGVYDILFKLQCTAKLATKLIDDFGGASFPARSPAFRRLREFAFCGWPASHDTGCLVVAQVAAIRQPLLILDEYEFGAELSLEPSEGTFIATGKCLDIVPLADLVE